MPYPPLGLQLSIFNGHFDMATQMDAVLRAAAAAGYAAIEGGLPGSVDAARQLAEQVMAHGLVFAGPHITPTALQNVPLIAEQMHVLKAADICNSGLIRWNDRSAAGYAEAITVLNKAGRELRGAGIRLHYHHHDFEFGLVDSHKSGMDLLIDGLDPDACDLCVDVAWVKKGGSDPAEFLKAHADKIGYLHLKDFAGDEWRELGRGTLDWPAIMAAVSELPHVQWAMVEQDKTEGDPAESVALSRQFLQSTFGY